MQANDARLMLINYMFIKNFEHIYKNILAKVYIDDQSFKISINESEEPNSQW